MTLQRYSMLAIAAFAVLVVVGGLLLYRARVLPVIPTQTQRQTSVMTKDWLKTQPISDYLHAGDYANAERLSKDILSSADSTASEKVRAKLASAHLAFAQSADPADVIDSIRMLKTVVADPAGIVSYKARAIDLIAEWYHLSSYNQTVFEEVFSGSDYSKYLIPDKRQASLRNLYQWSYDVKPSYRAAIGVAHSYVDEVLAETQLDSATRESYIMGAKDYLARAEADADRTKNVNTDPESTGPYIGYLVRRAYVLGGLAALEGGPYITQYEDAYQQLFTILTTNGNAFTKQYLPSAHIEHAFYLSLVEKKNEEAKSEAQVAVALLQAEPDIKLNRTLRTIRGLQDTSNSDTDRIHVISAVEAISPEFKAFVQSEQ